MNKNALRRIAVWLAVVVIGSTGLLACAPQSATSQGLSAAAAQQTLGALQVELNQTATAEKNGLIQQATSDAQTQTAAAPTSTLNPTTAADLEQTQQTADVLLKIQQYSKENYLPSTEGVYQRLNDQTLYYADAGKYKITDVGMNLDDFAYESYLSWENPGQPAKDIVSGCGFVFHYDGDKNYIMAYLGLDGNVYLSSVVNSVPLLLGKAPFGKVDPLKGYARISLVVSGAQYTMLVNGKMVLQENSGSGSPKTGQFAYLVYSGSNEIHGTACKFYNIDLWRVKPSK